MGVPDLPTVTLGSELFRFLGKIEVRSGQYVFSRAVPISQILLSTTVADDAFGIDRYSVSTAWTLIGRELRESARVLVFRLNRSHGVEAKVAMWVICHQKRRLLSAFDIKNFARSTAKTLTLFPKERKARRLLTVKFVLVTYPSERMEKMTSRAIPWLWQRCSWKCSSVPDFFKPCSWKLFSGVGKSEKCMPDKPAFSLHRKTEL